MNLFPLSSQRTACFGRHGDAGNRRPRRYAGALTLLGVLVCGAAGPTGLAQFYRAGDVIEEFTLTNRTTREPIRMSDFAGKILFIEWFAWWCPFCQAAAPQVEAGVVEYYASRGGNPDGIPVVHLAVNLQRGQESQTQNFIERAGFTLVAEDFNRALAARFQSGGQPIFAIINGVTNSPSHQPGELLLHQNGYGSTTSPIERFRAAIDAVQAPPVVPVTITRQPDPLTVVEGAPAEFTVEANGPEPLGYQWFHNGQPLEGRHAATLAFDAVTPADAGTYYVEITGAGETIASAHATLEVLPPIPPRLRLGQASDGDGLELRVETLSRRRHRLEVSQDLVTWELSSEFVPEETDARVPWLAPDGVTAQFYRVVLP